MRDNINYHVMVAHSAALIYLCATQNIKFHQNSLNVRISVLYVLYLTSSANIALIQSWSIKQLAATNKYARAAHVPFGARPLNFGNAKFNLSRTRYRVI